MGRGAEGKPETRKKNVNKKRFRGDGSTRASFAGEMLMRSDEVCSRARTTQQPGMTHRRGERGGGGGIDHVMSPCPASARIFWHGGETHPRCGVSTESLRGFLATNGGSTRSQLSPPLPAPPVSSIPPGRPMQGRARNGALPPAFLFSFFFFLFCVIFQIASLGFTGRGKRF